MYRHFAQPRVIITMLSTHLMMRAVWTTKRNDLYGGGHLMTKQDVRMTGTVQR